MTLLVKKDGNRPVLRSNLWDLFDFDRMLGDEFFSNQWLTRIPPTNIKETEAEYLIEMAVPGMVKDDFEVNVNENLLSISAEKELKEEKEEDEFTRREYSYNSFSRSFRLPDYVMADKIDAKYEDGILKFHIPKMEMREKKAIKEIKIK